MKLHELRLLRRIFIPILSRWNFGDVTIRHHYTRDQLRLHSFHHKGYWFHGRKREKDSMELFIKMINPGDTVIEVGGHIGYISLFLRKLAYPGRVIVFEPGENNLPYIRQNVKGKGIELVEKAVGRSRGVATFFLDPLTGQNNSLMKSFEGFEINKRNAGLSGLEAKSVQVEVISLDDYAAENALRVAFVKVDVEGFEWGVLQGMAGLMKCQNPRLMVEVQADQGKIFEFLTASGYVLFDSRKNILKSPAELRGNVFCLHKESHGDLISLLHRGQRSAAMED